MVQGLICEGTKRWDEVAIRSNLCHEDVAKVLQIYVRVQSKKIYFRGWMQEVCS